MHIDWDLLLGCWDEEATPEERARLARWLAADSAHGRLLDAAFLAADDVLRSPDVGAVEQTGDQRVIPLVSRGRARPAWIAGVGALAVIAIAIGVVRFEVGVHRPRASRAVAERVIATRPGEMADVRLPDGTRVLLGAASVLRYAVAGTARAREVVLVGEGYFEVAHDTTRPFRVHVGGTIAEDIGTAFDLRAYAGDPGVRIVVSNGAVSIRADSTRSPIVLRRGSLGVVGATGNIRVTTGVAVDRYLAWTRGQLVFTDESLGIAVADISRRFDVAIRLGDPALAERRLTASFADDPIDAVVTTLERAMNLRAVHESEKITLYPR
jgi:transmembrane sensor